MHQGKGVGSADFTDGLVKALVVIASGVGHTLELQAAVKVCKPQIQKSIRVVNFQPVDVDFGQGEPFDHRHPVFHAHAGFHTLIVCVGKTQRLGWRVHRIVE